MKEKNKTVFLVSHNSNLSGAPISLAQLAQKLPSCGYNPVYILPKEGPIESLLKKTIDSNKERKNEMGKYAHLKIKREF
jgi:hypothetical protein